MDAAIGTRASAALRLTGRDALTVLNRVTTQRLDDLGAGEARTTLFCDFRGRLQHRVTVAHATDGAVWLLREDGPGAELAAHVDRSVFREEVRIEDRSGDWPVTLVVWPDTAEPVGAQPAIVPVEGGFALALGRAAAAAQPADEAMRIERGRARHGAEIVDEYTPYEVNLAAHVHLAKGCYTGQEALQRLMTYGSVRRRLVRFEGHRAPPEPQALFAGGEETGRLTSVAGRGDGWIALAVVKIAALESGESFALSSGATLPAPRPFPLAMPLR